MVEKKDGGNYHFCPNCWRSEPEVEFYEEEKGYEWQYCQFCKLCERYYQQKFMERYPKTKRRHKLPFLTKEELIYYHKMIEEERGFKGDSDD